MTSDADDKPENKLKFVPAKADEETSVADLWEFAASDKAPAKKPKPYSPHFAHIIDLFNFYKEFSDLSRYLIISIADEGRLVPTLTNVKENAKDIQDRIDLQTSVSNTPYRRFIMALDLKHCVVNQLCIYGIQPRTFDLNDQEQLQALFTEPVNFSDPKIRQETLYARISDGFESSGTTKFKQPREVRKP
ncbi:MAG: hypothetical protein MRY79_00665 [Alphaproteobacteria bacterium]|nr:hypothetical protein [Alphaproteobacteria bacterium]